MTLTPERIRLKEAQTRQKHWKRWGPYLSERQWGTVREDYSPDGAAWEYFPHDHARSRAYRWGEDGIGGICDRHGRICFAVSFWNGNDPFLKERLFGVTGNEGNHGEDVKEQYWYLDSTPTHSYMKFLYKYPHQEFPYQRLTDENARRTKLQGEYELIDTGVFDENRYFDIFIEYAKNSPDDILIKITAHNRGPEPAPLTILPTLWFRNVWSWRHGEKRPNMRTDTQSDKIHSVRVDSDLYTPRWLYVENCDEILFTENDTNVSRLFGAPMSTPYVKDSINDYVVHGARDRVNPSKSGTKCASLHQRVIPAGGCATLRLRLSDLQLGASAFDDEFDLVFADRIAEADEFYSAYLPNGISADAAAVQRQAFAGLLWSKQFYHFDLQTWLDGDPAQPAPSADRRRGRNREWRHLYNADVISMPDKWEYPWYASWDLAFHCIPLALVDPDFAKEQLVLFLREWYMHPNGQLPAYEWAFSDVNPPVHAWASWRVYKIDKRHNGVGDTAFLEKVFHKLLINFTWWVNRKDADGMNVFQGGFLGLDNIGVFDRSKPLPTGGYIEQSDGTSWMAMYSLNMLAIALELSKTDPAYEDVASKFLEHFVHISHAMNHLGDDGIKLWNEEDGFYYDVLHLPDGTRQSLRVRSMVGLIPLFAVETLEPEVIDALPGFKRRMQWFIDNHADAKFHLDQTVQGPDGVRRLLCIAPPLRLMRVLEVMLDESEFLSPHGIRSLSRRHEHEPYILHLNGEEHRVDYEPAESRSGLFGGNSNWRGPIWFPLNYLLIESLQKYHHYYGDRLLVEFPTGSKQLMNLREVAAELSRRLTSLFVKSVDNYRPIYADNSILQQDPHWRDLVLFHEYFHGDTGEGLGACHQTGWTSLVAKLILQSGEKKPATSHAFAKKRATI